MVEIFDDRVEISNPGGVPKGITNENFGTLSVVRNPVLASMLHRIHYIEKMGTGIERIKKDLENAKQQKPKFNTSGFFKITFRRAILTENVTENVTENKEKEIIELINKNNHISTIEIAEKLSVTRMTVHRYLEKLKSKGLIERIGPDKGGYWRIKESDGSAIKQRN